MARKDLLKGLMDSPATETKSEPKTAPQDPEPAPRRRPGGAIGAVSQSIAELKTRALSDIDPELIDAAGLPDRLEAEAGLDALEQSLRDYGQQVPVMLRESRSAPGRYEVVYGRRRVAALKRLGQPVRALIRDLDDRDLVVAQGQENSARRDLSFIEKANFARQMVEAGFERRVICDALHVDKTVVSRMLSVLDAVPFAVVEAIGAAPSAGRDRWLKLAGRIGDRPVEEVTALARGATSDDRFAAVLAALAPAAKPRRNTSPLAGAGGAPLGEVRRQGSRTVLALETTDGFEDWLVEQLPELHARYLGKGSDQGK